MQPGGGAGVPCWRKAGLGDGRKYAARSVRSSHDSWLGKARGAQGSVQAVNPWTQLGECGFHGAADAVLTAEFVGTSAIPPAVFPLLGE